MPPPTLPCNAHWLPCLAQVHLQLGDAERKKLAAGRGRMEALRNILASTRGGSGGGDGGGGTVGLEQEQRNLMMELYHMTAKVKIAAVQVRGTPVQRCMHACMCLSELPAAM